MQIIKKNKKREHNIIKKAILINKKIKINK